MKPVAQRLLEFLGYSLWFSVIFMLLTWLTFPWSRVRDHAMIAAHDSGIGLQLDSLRASTSSVKARGLHLSSVAEDAEPWLSLDTLRVGSSTSGVISAALALRAMMQESSPSNSAEASRRVLNALGQLKIDADLYDGEFKLLAESDGEVSRINSQLEKLSLDDYTVALRSFAANPRGKLKGGSDITWHWEDAKKSSGSIDMVANGLILDGLTVAGFGLPETAFDRSEAHIKISRGRAEFRDTAFDSDVVQVVVEGYINLNTELPRSRLALRMRFKVRDDLDGLLKVQFGSNPRHKDTRGWYHYQVNGTLKRPRLRESPAAARRGRKEKAPKAPTTTKPTAASSTDNETPGEDSGSNGDLQEARRQELDEERERLREERTRRREERKDKRDELIRKRNERQAEIDSGEDSRGSPEDIVIEDEEVLRSNFKEGGEGEPAPEAEESQGDGENDEE
jgi:type II secretion system protein N